ncbi:DEAD/DEAH box helicase, partial [Acidianus sp. RZ1]|uniref:DEAD/DEAH box helicase n=1 Tax=Acidianus sp. RZ1 TaxID=1540082 RepID=UPI0014930550|nr:DEAD/DEAH box helicase [Acidianus sp. RZ1]
MFLKTFYLKQWIDEDTFSRLLTFSRFLGRDDGVSQFAIDLDRARLNGVKIDDIESTLKELGIQLSTEELEKIRNHIPSYDVEFEVRQGRLIIIPHVYIMNILKAKSNTDIKYDKLTKYFFSSPYYYEDLLKLFEENGLRVRKLQVEHKDFDFELDVNLRSYQIEAVEAWKSNNFRGVISLPTGSGKTIIGIKAIEEVKKPTLIISFTKEQMFQWRDSIIKFSKIRPEIGLFYSDEKVIRPITISTYQTAYRHLDDLSTKFEVLIIDEVHHLPADKFKNIALGLISSMRLGLSATPYRDDGRHDELFRLMGGLIYYKSPNDLIKTGYLAPYDVIQVSVYLSKTERQRYKDLTNKFRVFSKGKRVTDLVTLAKNGDYNAINALKIYSEIKKLIGNAENKTVKLREILEKEKGKKILIFTQYVEQAESIAREFNAMLVTGKMIKSDRKEILKRFKTSAEGRLVLTTVGDEGLDIPDASVGIIVTGTSSRRQFIQRLGRLLRPMNGKRAILYELIVKGTSEEYQAKKRKTESLLEEL